MVCLRSGALLRPLLLLLARGFGCLAGRLLVREAFRLPRGRRALVRALLAVEPPRLYSNHRAGEQRGDHGRRE